MKYIAAVGMFDGVHLGHRFVVEQLCREAAARGLAPMLITFRSHPLETLRPELAPAILTEVDFRRQLLREAGVERVEVLDFDRVCRLTATEFLSVLHHDFGVEVLMMGFNNHIGSDRQSAASLGSHCAGVDIILLPPYPGSKGLCSSATRRALAEGRVDDARTMLGRPYSLRGTVVHGKQLGRTLGFPTANINPASPSALVPGSGVYAADVHIHGDGTPRRAMLNVGQCPTVGGCGTTIEAHIIDFDRDIYGREVTVDFLTRLRDEQQFAGLDELKAQLALDRLAAISAK